MAGLDGGSLLQKGKPGLIDCAVFQRCACAHLLMTLECFGSVL